MNHQRKSIRLKGYEYAQAGLCFITICTYNRGKEVLNNAGAMAVTCWQEISKHFSSTVLHEYLIVPNHVQGISEVISPPNKLLPADVNYDSPLIKDIIHNTAKDVLHVHGQY